MLVISYLVALCAWSQLVAGQSSSRSSSVPASTTPSSSQPSSSFSRPSASVGSQASITPAAACTACLLEALYPITLKYPTTVDGNTTVTTASVNAYPTVYPDGRTFTVRYETTTLTIVVKNSTDTIFASASWSTYGTWLTWPTTYILYNNFGLATNCATSPTGIPLPASTDPAKLIFPLQGDMGAVPRQIESYLNTLDIPDNGTDFTTCNWAVLAASVARRSGRLPVPFGPRHEPWKNARKEKPKRDVIELVIRQNGPGFNGTNPAATAKQTAFVLTDTTQTQAAFTIPLEVNDRGQAPIDNTNNNNNNDNSNNNNNGNNGNNQRTGDQQGTNQGDNSNNGNSQQQQGSTTNQGDQGNTNQGNTNQGTTNQDNGLSGAVVGAVFGDSGLNNQNSGQSNQGNQGGSNENTGSGSTPNGNSGGGNSPGSNSPGSNSPGSNSPGSNQPGQGDGSNGGTVPAGNNGNNGNSNGNGNNNGNGNGNSNGNGNGQGSSGSGSGNSGGSQVINIGDSAVTVAPVPPSSGSNNEQSGGAGAGSVVVGSVTLGVGQVGTVNGQQVSVASGGNVVVGSGSGAQTIAVGSNNGNNNNQPPSITVGGNVVTANPSGAFVVAPGVTLAAGGPAVTVGGSTLSLAAGGTIAIVNGATMTLASGPSAPTGAALLTINGQTITAGVVGNPGSTAFVIAPGTTLTPGGSVVVSGTTFALPATGSSIVINGVTSPLGVATAPARVTPAPNLTINGATISPTVVNSKTYYSIAPGTTLTPGGEVTISGTRISLATDGASLVFGSSTSSVQLASASASKTSSTTQTTRSVGDAIASGISATKKAGAAGLDIGVGFTLESIALGLMGMVVYWL